MDFFNDDPYGGMDSVEFQMYGYGGFGYDTSHVKPAEKTSELVKAAKAGDLEQIQSNVRNASTESDEKLRSVINHARRWTEVDYKMSGFTKEWEWFGLTPLATAALHRHDNVVEFLLRQGADPTLKGCPDENVDYDAFSAAKQAMSEIEKGIETLRTVSREDLKVEVCGQVTIVRNSFKRYEAMKWKGPDSKTPQQYATELVQKQAHRRVLEMLEAVKPFWKQAPYCSAHYHSERRKKFTNQSTDMKSMIAALDAAVGVNDYDQQGDEDDVR